MKKYNTEFKLEIVKSFLADEGGAKLLARQWSVPEDKIRSWVSHCRLHGLDGLRPKPGAYNVQFKLQVLSHQDCERHSSREVAAIYDIRDPNHVVVWRRNLDEGGVQALERRKPGYSNMKPERRSPVLENAVISDSEQALLAAPSITGVRRSCAPNNRKTWRPIFAPPMTYIRDAMDTDGSRQNYAI